MDVWLWIKRTVTVTVTVLAIVLAVWVLAHARLAVVVTATALLLALALGAPVGWLERRGVRRGAAIGLVMGAVIAVLASAFLIVAPAAGTQVRELGREVPTLVSRVQESATFQQVRRALEGGSAPLAKARDSLPQDAQRLVRPALAIVEAIVGGAAGLVTVLVLAAFMLAFGGELVQSAVAAARPERQVRYVEVLREIRIAVGGYVAGLGVLVATHAAFAGVFLAIVRVPWFVPLAILSGLLSVVPLVGTLVAGVLLSGVAWASRGVGIGIATAVYYVAYHQFENHVIAPLVYRRTVKLNPLVILLAVLFMTELAGVPGALAAVPLAACARIVLGEVLRARRERDRERPRASAGERTRGANLEDAATAPH